MELCMGLTCNMPNRDITLSRNYTDALLGLGITPLLLCGGDFEAMLSRIHGLILTGGGDIAVPLSGAEQARSVQPLRDAFEIALVKEAHARRIPILGICRGIQLLNVAFGGTLKAHIRGHSNGTEHGVVSAEDSFLAGALGVRAMVNSYHHQAVDRVAEGFRVTALAPDGEIEGIERDCLIGVQWHPEREAESGAFFGKFAQMCYLQNSEKKSMIYNRYKHWEVGIDDQ